MHNETFGSRTRLGGWAIALLVAVALAGGVIVTLAASENDCVGCERAGVKLDGAMLAGADFTGTDYYKASFMKANLTGTNFTNAKLTKVDFTGANLTDALLYGADMTGAKLQFAITTGALTGATTICPDGSAGPCSF